MLAAEKRPCPGFPAASPLSTATKTTLQADLGSDFYAYFYATRISPERFKRGHVLDHLGELGEKLGMSLRLVGREVPIGTSGPTSLPRTTAVMTPVLGGKSGVAAVR